MRRPLFCVSLALLLATCDDGSGPGGQSVAAVAVSPESDTLVVGGTLTLTATPQDDAGNPLPDQPVEWASGDVSVATVTSSGQVTGHAPGSTTIVATSGDRTGESLIAVSEGGIVGREGGTVSAQGGTVSLVIPEGALAEPTAITLGPVSEYPDVERVVSGTVFGLGPDEASFAQAATLTIRYETANVPDGVTEAELRLYRLVDAGWQQLAGSVVNTTTATVAVPINELGIYAILPASEVASVTVDPASATTVVGGTVSLEATVTDVENRVLPGYPVSWSSDNTAVATVDAEGSVSGVAEGTATITATADGHSGTAQITVTTGSVVATMGQWTPPFAWPIVAVHLHLLPTGKVLSFGKFGQPQVWDPSTGSFSERATATHVFCSGHAYLPDGRLLVTGGHIADDRGLRDANVFDPTSEAWTRIADMAFGRWYPTSTTLPNGEVLTLAGADENAVDVGTPEVLQTDGTWRQLTGAFRQLPYYPRMFLAPNGLVFYAGEQRNSRYLNPAGTGSWINVAQQQHTGGRQYGAAVMYEPGEVLYIGGGLQTITNSAEVIDLNQPAPAWRFTDNMAFARRHLNATLLPDGTVLVTGGTSGAGFNNPVGAVHAAELWDPTTEQWRTLASNSIVRIYHATSILLPDARVLHSGSGDAADQPGGGVAPDEKNAEIFSPPYLFNPDGSPAPRPTISSAPASVTYGEGFFVGTAEAASIAKVSLVRLGSTTHAFDQNQRFNRLEFAQTTGGLTVMAPANPNLAPPGHYMLFILNSNGVPSVAHIIRIG